MKDKKIKVLYISNYGGFYGANRSLLELILNMKKNFNVEPFVLVPENGEFLLELKKNNIKYIKIPYARWRLKKPFNLKEFLMYLYYTLFNNISTFFILKKIKKFNIDIIHTNSSVINIGAEIRKKTKIKHIWHFREYGDLDYNMFFCKNNNYLQKYINNYSDNVIFISNSLENHYNYLNINKSKKEVIYNGINVDNYFLDISREFNEINILFSGLIHENKNQFELIRALDIVINKYKIKNINAYIVGSGSKKYINKMERFINEKKLNNNIYFEGYQKDIKKYLSKCNVGIICSKSEAFGRVTVEYMMSGLMVIASNTGANPEIIDDEITGLLYEYNDYEKLAQKIILISKNKKLIKNIANAGQKKALDLFTSKKNCFYIYNTYLRTLKTE